MTLNDISSVANLVAEVDRFLATRPTTTYFEQIRRFDGPPVNPDAKAA